MTYPDPVGGSGKTHCLGAVASRVKLANDGPHDRCPSHRVTGDEQASECNHSRAGFGGVLGGLLVQGKVADGGKNQETDEHPETSSDQSTSSTESFDDESAWNGHGEVDTTEDHRCLERIIQAGRCENGCTCRTNRQLDVSNSCHLGPCVRYIP